MSESWPRWQDEVINGVYSLRRLLHASRHSAVFLAECEEQDPRSVAIKIIPAERVTLAQLSHWRAAADLSHPHLIRLLDAGLCQLEGRQFLFVVMEYAEQSLSQVLLRRPLTPDEVLDMLPPVLDALTFLHRKNLVQGELKPANILVVNDQLKLASDPVRPSGEPRASIADASSLYDPPEAADGRLSPAGDIWALGVTVVEALTQSLPASLHDRGLPAAVPTPLAPTLVVAVQRCLNHDPSSRPTATDLEALLNGAPQAPAISLPESGAPQAAAAMSVPASVPPEAPARAPPLQSSPAPPLQSSPGQRALLPIVATALILSAALWAGLHLFQSHPSSSGSAAGPVKSGSRTGPTTPAAASQTPHAPAPAPARVPSPSNGAKSVVSKPAPPRPASRPPAQPVEPTNGATGVLYENLPSVPHSASATIHGHVKVTVLVIVDPSGTVNDAILESPGPSAYFARLAREAARKWKFVPAADAASQDSREALIKFEFTRTGTTAHAVPRS